MQENLHRLLTHIRPKMIKRYINKTLSVLRLGNDWFNRLVATVVEAGRTISYVETVNPKQSDTFHKEIKYSDIPIFKREFESVVRKSLKKLRLNRVKVAIDVTEDPYWGKNGSYNTRSKFHVNSDESWQYATLSVVEPKFVPLMSLPYRQIDNLDDIVIESPNVLRSRQTEYQFYRDIWGNVGKHVLHAPRPSLLDSTYSHLPTLSEDEPVFDAANILRFNRDILYLVSFFPGTNSLYFNERLS